MGKYLLLKVQVIPWVLSDSNFMRSASQKLDPSKTVFVGGLHGMINAGKTFHLIQSYLQELN